MSQYNEGNKTFVAGENLAQYRRVKLSSGSGDTVVYADAESAIGITQEPASEGQQVTVALLDSGRTFKAEVFAEGEIPAGSFGYGYTDGKVGYPDFLSSLDMFYVLEALTGDGSIGEILPHKED